MPTELFFQHIYKGNGSLSKL